jgi:very-short-patch-repair endonuclease
MVSPELVVCTLGHLASTEELRERGVPAGAIRSGLARGALIRVARARYACAHLGTLDGRDDQLAAARAHGRIGCLTALRRAGVWAGDDARLHLQLRPGQHGTGRDRVDARHRPIVYHWSEPFCGADGPSPSARRAVPRPAVQAVMGGTAAAWHVARMARAQRSQDGPAVAERMSSPHDRAHDTPYDARFDTPSDNPHRVSVGRCWLVEPMEAVWRAIHCLDEENAIACLESAVHEGFITAEQLLAICAVAPEHLQAGIAEIEFTADSGQETIVRRRLRHAGFRVVAQETPKGMPAEDLVVEDCVDLETDGKQWHGLDRFQADRDRDLLYEGLGRRVLRITQRHVVHEWDTTLAAIARVVEDAQRAKAGRRTRSGPGYPAGSVGGGLGASLAQDPFSGDSLAAL